MDLSSEVGLVYKKIIGLGFTVKYKYSVEKEENSDSIQVIILSGEFKLFVNL